MMHAEGDDESTVDRRRQDEATSHRSQKPTAVDNCWQHTGLCCFKAKQRTQISALEYKLKKRQKKFGVDYLSLVERKASEIELKRCLRNAMDEIEQLQDEIEVHLAEIEGREMQVQEATAASKPPNQDVEEYVQDPVEKKTSKKKKSKAKKKKEPDRPVFTIDSDEDESYGQEQPQPPKKKKANKKKKSPAQ